MVDIWVFKRHSTFTARLLDDKVNNNLPAFLIPPEAKKGVRAKVEEGVFASRSHAVEYAVRQLMRQERRPNPGEAA